MHEKVHARVRGFTRPPMFLHLTELTREVINQSKQV